MMPKTKEEHSEVWFRYCEGRLIAGRREWASGITETLASLG